MLGIFRRQHAEPTPAQSGSDYQAGYQAGILTGVTAALILLDETLPAEYPARLRGFQADLRSMRQPTPTPPTDTC